MALLFAPHSVTVKPFEQKKSAKHVANNVVFTAGEELLVCINSKEAQAVFDETGITLTRPHKMLMNLEDASKVRLGDQVLWGSRKFRVETPVRISQHGLPTDHASAMLEELE